jgi:histidyl-tRNA synthetase
VNHRGLLDGVFAVCGVPAGLFAPICSAVDKLDKLPWADVRSEMTMKGLPEESADKIWAFVSTKGTAGEVLAKLRGDAALLANAQAAAALGDLDKLFVYLQAFRADAQCILDLSLARGLSYYTGVIFEAVLTDSKVHVGSVGGGGRYDKLVGRFKKKGDIPCVGFSVGVERLFTVMQELRKTQNVVARSNTTALVCSADGGALVERMGLCAQLWEAGIAAELLLKDEPKIQAQLKYAEAQQIPYAVIFGSDEWKAGTVKVKNLATREQEEVPRGDLVEYLRKKTAQ